MEGDDAFTMHLGVLGQKELSFSERLRQARQLDALLESFSDAEDSSDDEWAGSTQSVSRAMPRGTVAVAAARPALPSLHPCSPTLPLAKHPCSPAHPLSPAGSLAWDAAASAATTRIASGCSSSTASTQGHSHLSLPLPAPATRGGAQVWAPTDEDVQADDEATAHLSGLSGLSLEGASASPEREPTRPPRLGSARRLRPCSRDGRREVAEAARYDY